jgi:hypothetical protein
MSSGSGGANQASTGAPPPESEDSHSASPLEIESSKLVLSNSFEFIRATAQILQGLTGLLLTSYITLLVGFCKDSGIGTGYRVVFAFLPLLSLGASLSISIVQAIRYRGSQLVIDEHGNPLNAFETLRSVLTDRRRHLRLPAILTSIGVVTFIVAFFAVFADDRKAAAPARQRLGSAIIHESGASVTVTPSPVPPPTPTAAPTAVSTLTAIPTATPTPRPSPTVTQKRRSSRNALKHPRGTIIRKAQRGSPTNY